MDKVTLDGKVYEKSAVVAKRFGYTTDYIGQLSRADKIDAQLVGRSWYVHAPSVEEYQETLYEDDQVEESQTTSKERTSQSVDKANIEPKSSTSRINETTVRPRSIPKKLPLRTSASSARVAHNASPTPTPNWYKISYEPDSGELLPKLDKKAIDINVYEQSKSTKNFSQPGLRIHCDSPQFSMVDKVEETPPKRRHQSVGVEQMRPPRSNPSFTEAAYDDHSDSESLSELNDVQIHHGKLFLLVALATLAAVYGVLLLTLLSVRTVTYDTSSGTFLYTFQIESVSSFREAL